MQKLRSHITYANVMSSLAVFLVLGGATAFAAAHLNKNSVGSRQLKKQSVNRAKIKLGAVTGAKVLDKSLTGADIDLNQLGTVPSAETAGNAKTATSAATAQSAASAKSALSADSVLNRYPVAQFINPGRTKLLTVAPFTIQGRCTLDEEGEDVVELQLETSVDGAAMKDAEGDEKIPFNVEDNPVELFEQQRATGNPLLAPGEGEFVAVGPEGSTLVFENQSVGVNLPGRVGQCYVQFIADKIG